MIIHQPELVKRDGQILLFARVESPNAERMKWPKFIWYRYPESYEPYISLQSEAFLLPALMGAMYVNEAVEVRGGFSPKVAYHLGELQRRMALLKERFEFPMGVTVKFERLAPLVAQPQAVVGSYSGGVDSLFSIYQHLPGRQPDPANQITHGLNIRGFDIALNDARNLSASQRLHQQALADMGLDFLTVETNAGVILRSFSAEIPFYNTVLAGVVHSLAKLIRVFYLPSSSDINMVFATRGVGSMVDHLMSTETTEIIHHGASYTRVEKTLALGAWPVAHKNLRVCFFPDYTSVTPNCSRCAKCWRTMIPLYAAGKLDEFATFRFPVRRDIDIVRFALNYSVGDPYYPEIVQHLKAHRPGLMPYFRAAQFLGVFQYYLRKLASKRSLLKRFRPSPRRASFTKRYDLPEVIEQLEALQGK